MSALGLQRGRQKALSFRNQGEWLQIQRNTFTNWVNENLRTRGIVIDDVRTDLSDGVTLVALVEALIKEKVPGAVTRPSNQYQKLQNITVALDALSKDGVKLVNIGSSDIVASELKLVLALVWALVHRYQVGGMTLTQHKAWLLAWLHAVIPDCSVTNFTTDWNDGIALHALLDFCKPGLSAYWRTMNRQHRLENCQSAMKLARQNFNIPLVLRPENLASTELDELSAITYLSYFTRVGGPGYDATLQRVAPRTLPYVVGNFTRDWQDGQALVNLVRSAGGSVQSKEDTEDKVELIQAALDAGQQQLGIEPILSAKEINSQHTQHLGMMTYSAQYFRYSNPAPYEGYHLTEPKTRVSNNVTYSDVNGGLKDNNVSIIKTNYSSRNGNAKYLQQNGNHDFNHNHSQNHNHTNINSVNSYQYTNGYRNTSNSNNNSKDIYSQVFRPLKVTTVYNDNDEDTSTHASTVTSAPSSAAPVFHLLRKSDVHAARVEAPSTDQLKVDIYSVGVIMDSKMTGTFDPDKLKVEAVAPTGRVIRITGDGHYAAPFNGDEIGRWKVSMYYDGRYMDGCPIDVCDPSQVKIRDLQGGHVGKPNVFHVDCTQAGPGDLGVDVSMNGRPVSTHINPTSTPGYFKVNFTPFSAGPYEVNVHFNRAEVREGDVTFFDPDERQRKAVFIVRVDPKPDCVEVKASCDWEVDYITGKPFICHVTDSTDISVYGMEDGTVCAHPELIADCTRVGEGNLTAEVTHNGLRYPCKVRKDRPCVYRVSFKPRGPGTYKVWVYYDGQQVKGSPFVQEIAELEKPTAHGDGLYRGVPGKPATFTVDPRGFPGQVSVAVNGPTRPVSSQLEPQHDSTIKATYFPNERGPHTVHVKLDGKNIDGSPYHPLIVDPVKVRVSGGWRPYLDEKGLIPLKVNKEKHLPFDVSEAGPGELTSEIQGPNGKIPVTIDARNDGKHSVIFTPREEGKHYIHVNWGGYPLHNSPYMGYATHAPEEEDEFPNVRLVPIPLHSPTHPMSVRSSQPESFVDGPLNRSAYSPIPQPHPHDPVLLYYGPMAPLNGQPDRHDRGPQRPSKGQPKRGNYGHQRPSNGQPVRDYYEPQRPMNGQCFPEDSRHQNPFNGQPAPEDHRPQRPFNGQPVLDYYEPQRPSNGQPYKDYYEPHGPSNGRPIREQYEPQRPVNRQPGPEDNRPLVPYNGQPIREDHPSQLPVSRRPVDKDGLVPQKPQPKQRRRVQVEMLPTSPVQGYPGYPPSSPRSVSVRSINSQPTRSPNGPQKVILSGRGLKEAEVNKPAQFQVDGTQANPGKPQSHLQGVRDQLPVSVENVRPQVYKCTYIPERPGAYLLYVNWNDKPLKGSPYKVAIREPCRPDKVIATLERPNTVLGEDLEMKVDPRNAGPGQLTVRCTDPTGHEVPVRMNDNYDGTKSLKMTPTMPGRYLVDIRYDGTHIMGSPYAIDIKAANTGLLPVKCWGPGIENGIIPDFQSTFWVETTGAGAGDLRVRIMGPKGAFHVKMRKASQRDKIYQCFYDPVEPGIYTVHVQWSGVHVAGSPFQVLLATSDRELERMQEVLNEGGTSSIINGNYNNHYHHNNSVHLNSSRSDVDNDVTTRRSREDRFSKASSRHSAGREINSEDLNDILY